MNHENQLQAYLTLDPARNRIRIHRQTIRLLKNPAYVQFLVNPEELYIAVLGSETYFRRDRKQGSDVKYIPAVYRIL